MYRLNREVVDVLCGCLTVVALLAGPAAEAGVPADDPYLWLEEVEGEKALDWVRARNARSLARLEKDERYAPTEKAVREVLLAKDRIPAPTLRGGWIYNFWRDEKNVRGVWRRTSLSEYATDTPKWDVLLDVDELARRENENWVYKGISCLHPEDTRCIVQLSRGGKDAVVARELDVEKRELVADGFHLPEAKSNLGWIDRDTVFVSTDFGPGSLTTSGYPRIVKVWKRGTPLESAATIFEADAKDVGARAGTYFRPEGNVAVVTRYPSFFEEESHLWKSGKLLAIPFPIDASFLGAFEGRLFAQLRSDWKPEGRLFRQGSVVAIPLETLDVKQAENVLEPAETMSIQSVVFSRSAAFVSLLDDVAGRILELRRDAKGHWSTIPQAYPDHGSLGISAHAYDDAVIASYASFLVPSTFYVSARAGVEPKLLKRAPERFEARGFVVERHFAVSRDGTRIPYFVVRPEKLAMDGSAPTLLGGYGGFEQASTPFYLAERGRWWLEKGGVYVLANIRGGGEYGPRWHQAVLKENRPKVFDDFVAVAEDLIARKITSPRRLGISGGSNGGLLVGASFTRRPDLFAAVACAVPLLDMLRYHKLLAGASWMAEYGDPDVPAMREVLRSYSPYHNLAPEKTYPEVFFFTSTKDDRVHPGHARKMAARMEEMGHPFLYYENIEGGHGAAANLEQLIHRTSLQAVYLYQKLVDGK